MFQRLINRLLGRILGMTGRASRLDLDSGAARDFTTAPPTPPKGKPLLRVIEGGRSSAQPSAPTPRRPQPAERRRG